MAADGKRVAEGSVFPYRLMKARIINSFELAGSSTHSDIGHYVGVVVEHCLANNIDFMLLQNAGGFYIGKLGS